MHSRRSVPPAPSASVAALALIVLLACTGCGGPPPAPESPEVADRPAAAALPDGNDRLDRSVTPLRVRLDLRVDPARETTRGHAEIDVAVAAPTQEIRLHGDKLTLTSVQLRVAGAPPRPGQGVFGPHGGLAVRFDSAVPAGEATLVFDYQAPLGEVPESLYRVREGEAWYAFSQFEPLEARAAFPCFDQPEFKIPWEVVLRVPPGQRAFANMPETSRRMEDGLQVVVFAPTPPLPSYLLAFAVGPLDVLEAPPAPGAPPLRIVTTAGRAREAAYALRETPRILASLERWFGIPYPFPKLDLVAVPNFSAGAMENPGLVTFRERLLLLDEQSPAGQRAGMFGVIAHELAHMWFGDLVTMQWWDDLWLNEAFATWMATRTVQEVAPEFESDVDQAAGAAGALSLDAQPSTRSVRQPIRNGGDVYNAFDGITYGKGALVLGMLEAWLGPDAFRDGVRRYLSAHARGNATTADLVSALSASAAGAPVGSVVESFTAQPGAPLVKVEVRCPATGRPLVAVRQSRFKPVDGPAPDVAPWHLPLCVRYALPGRPTPIRECLLLDRAEAELPLTQADACPLWLHPNADERGYYRWTLPPAARDALLVGARASLTLRERVVIPALTGAWLEAGLLPIDQAAELYLGLGGEQHRTLLTGAIWGLRAPFRLLGEAPDPRLTRRLETAFWPHVERLGLDPRPDEHPDARFLRSSLLWAFWDMTESPRLLARAREVAASFTRNPAAVDPELSAQYVPMAAQLGDLDLWLRLSGLLNGTLRAGDRETILRALASFRDPALLERTLNLGLGDPLRAQDLRSLMSAGGGREAARRTVWRWLTSHYDAVVARLGDKATPGLPFTGAGLCTAEERTAVEAFFAARRDAPEGTERNLKLTLESIDRCLAFKARHEATARRWLDGQPR